MNTPAASPISRAEIEAAQLDRLRTLIAALRTSNPFYRPILEDTGLDDSVADLAAFSSRCPFTTKQQITEDQRANPPYGTNLTEPLENYTRFHQTSGTTAEPIRGLDTPGSWQGMVDSWKVIFEAAGVGKSDRVMFTFSFGPFLGFWMAFEAATQLGCLTMPGGALSTTARLKMILDNNATAICCTPTYAMRLAEVALSEGISLESASVRAIIVAGEPGGSIPAVRQRIEAAWPNATVYDHHGMTETGPVTYQQPGIPGLIRVIEDAYLAEIIDPSTLKPAEKDQPGELVLTTLTRTASPLLRYRTGDLVLPKRVHDDGSPGGAHLAFEGGILSRADDMLTIRGVNVYPAAVDQIIRSVPTIAEYRAFVDTDSAMPDLRIEIEPLADHEGDASVAGELQQRFRDKLNLRIPVQTVPPETLPRFEMKARRWIKSSSTPR